MENSTHISIYPPKESEYALSYSAYIQAVKHNELIDGLSETRSQTIDFLNQIPKDKLLFAYQPGKWTIKQVVEHMLDTERIFAYRALQYSRNDATILSPFDEDAFAQNCESNARNWFSMLEEYRAVRQSTIELFKNFTTNMLDRKGQAGQNQLSVRALGFATLGHEIHHVNIIRERYLD